MSKPPPDPTPSAWLDTDTMAYLDMNPLPVDFQWFHRNKDKAGKPLLVVVKPTYHIRDGYGKWLHDTPYFPGLFELIHDLLFHSGAQLPGITTLTATLERIKAERIGQADLF